MTDANSTLIISRFIQTVPKLLKMGQNKTAAAMVIPSRNLSIGWRLPNVSIMSAELFGIIMALEWFSETADVPEGLILTDSLSSIQLIRNSNSKKHNVYIYKIQRLLEEIKNQNKVIAICWIPSHRGIPGNENADTAAKQATNENIITIPNIAKLDGKSFIKDKMETAWDNYWSVSVQNTNTGKHLKNIKDNTDYWPWTSIPDKRKMETVLARLRIGHCGLRAHMYRFGMTVLPLCECGLYETIEHYLI